MLLLYILFLAWPVSVESVSTITVDSLVITQVQDPDMPNENSNAYVITSKTALEGFFVDTGATSKTVIELVSIYQQQVQSTTKPPQFVFLTHGHPDHMGGIAYLQLIYPTTPIYVLSQQVIREAVQWVGYGCSMGGLVGEQCAINYSTILRVLTSPPTQLVLHHPNVKLNALSVVIKGEASYEGFFGLTTPSGEYFLFTSDTITIQTHLFISNFFQYQTLPDSDDAVCAWAGSLQATACDLQLSNRKTTILPGHGPISVAPNYLNDIANNLAWFRKARNLTFNSCNATYIWGEMMREYPGWGGTLLKMKGSLGTHVPADANSVNCNCSNDTPTICPVYNAPPSCVHLDISDSDTTLACNVRRTSSSTTAIKPLSIQSFILMVLIAYMTLLHHN